MHKKKVGDKDYFYTTIRTDNGTKTKSIYLGRNSKEAKENELKLKNKSSFNSKLLIIPLIFFVVGFLFFLSLKITGFAVAETILDNSSEVLNLEAGINGSEEILENTTLINISENNTENFVDNAAIDETKDFSVKIIKNNEEINYTKTNREDGKYDLEIIYDSNIIKISGLDKNFDAEIIENG